MRSGNRRKLTRRPREASRMTNSKCSSNSKSIRLRLSKTLNRLMIKASRISQIITEWLNSQTKMTLSSSWYSTTKCSPRNLMGKSKSRCNSSSYSLPFSPRTWKTKKCKSKSNRSSNSTPRSPRLFNRWAVNSKATSSRSLWSKDRLKEMAISRPSNNLCNRWASSSQNSTSRLTMGRPTTNRKSQFLCNRSSHRCSRLHLTPRCLCPSSNSLSRRRRMIDEY